MTEELAQPGAHAKKLRMGAVAAVALYACLMGFLVLALYQEDRTLNVPLALLFAAGIAAAGFLGFVASRAAAWVALAYSILTTAADAPHQLGELAHPTGHAPVSAFILAVGVVAIVLSLLLALRTGSAADPRQVDRAGT